MELLGHREHFLTLRTGSQLLTVTASSPRLRNFQMLPFPQPTELPGLREHCLIQRFGDQLHTEASSKNLNMLKYKTTKEK